MISATLTDGDGSSFNIMYFDDISNKIFYIAAIKWYSSIYKIDDGYHIKYPDWIFGNTNIKDIYIANIDNEYINEETLYIPSNIASVNFCINIWCLHNKLNEDYFHKNSDSDSD